MKKLIKQLILFFVILFSKNIAQAQSFISPKYSVDGRINAMTTKGDTLIVGGYFNNVGIYTGGGALISTDSDKPNLNFPKLLGNVTASTSDGSGGFYVCGNYSKENEKNNIDYKIEHILSNFTFEKGFSLKVDAFRINQILYHNGILYIGGTSLVKVGGQVAGDLTAIDVKTQKILSWIPKTTTTSLGGVNNLKINNNNLYFSGGFTEVGNEKRNSCAAIELYTGKLKNWNPNLFGITAIEFYKDKIIIGGTFYDANFENHSLALVDTLTGQNSIQYVYNSSNFSRYSNVEKMTLSGDVLYTFGRGLGDTRVTAINLAKNNSVIWKKYFNDIANETNLVLSDNSLFVVGSYFDLIYKTNLPSDKIENVERKIKGAVKLDAQTGNLIQWFPDPTGLIVSHVNTISIAGKNVFIGGTFSHLNSLERSGILMLNTKTDEVLPFKLDIDYYSKDINAIKLIDSTLYLGGSFSKVNGKDFSTSVLACNIKSGQILPWKPLNLGNPYAIEADNKYVFLAGTLTEPSGGKNRVNLFAIDRKTGNLIDWSPNPNRGALSLHIFRNNLFVGGEFTSIAGQNRNYLSSFDLNTLNLNTWNPNTNSSVSALHSSGNTIWAGGNFSKIGTTNVSLFAGLDPNTGVVVQKSTFLQPFGSVNSIFVKGKYAMLGGDFSLNGSGTCGKFVIYDLLAKGTIPPISLCQDFSYVLYQDFSYTAVSRVNTFSMIKDNLYLGGSFLQVNQKANASNIGVIQFPKNFFEPKIDDYFPKSGGNGGDVTVNFYGDLIQQGMKVKLVSAGLPDIIVPDSMIKVVDDYTLRVVFDLRKKNIGLYSIKISTNNGVEYVIDKGFSIEVYKKPEISLQVVGPDAIRVGRPTKFLIQLNNNGNCNSNGIPIFIFISGNTKAKFLNSFSGVFGQKIDTIMYSIRDSFLGNKVKNKAYWLLIPQLLAGATKNIEIEITPLTNNEEVYVTAIANPPLFASPMPTEKSDCIFAIAKVVLDAALTGIKNEIIKDASQCLNGAISTYNNGLDIYRNYGSDNNIEIMDFGYGLASTIFSCASTASKFLPQLRVLSVLGTTFDVLDVTLGSAINGAQAAEKCKDNIDLNGNNTSKKTRSVASFDPNDKIGVGINAKHYITWKEPLQYGIRYENFATATAAAQYVKVIDTLDRSKVDLSTFQLNFFSFGNRIINVSPGQKKRTEFIDLRPQTEKPYFKDTSEFK